VNLAERLLEAGRPVMILTICPAGVEHNVLLCDTYGDLSVHIATPQLGSVAELAGVGGKHFAAHGGDHELD
jgi:hypothetical protein